MKLLQQPYLDAVAACISCHDDTDASSIECSLASFSLRKDKADAARESAIAERISAENAERRLRAASISSLLSAAGALPDESPPREGEDAAPPFASPSRGGIATVVSERILPVRTLATLIALLNDRFPDHNFK